jgi:hypothetical protein
MFDSFYFALQNLRSESKSKSKHREISPSPPRIDSRRRIDTDFDQSAVWAAEEKLTLEERRERFYFDIVSQCRVTLCSLLD